MRLQSSLLDGLVTKEQSGFYWVETSDSTTYICQLRGRLKEDAQSSDIVAIGDRVQFSLREHDGADAKQEGIIEEVAERQSVLSRSVRTIGKRGAGQAEREHVLIANADQALFVFAAAQPQPNFPLLDRFLVAGEQSAIEQLIIVINKVDLEDPSNIDAAFAPYARMGYRLIKTSALNNTGINELQSVLEGKISVFTGPSGVGKTSLLNCIQPGLGRQVKSVSNVTDEGVHTTRDSALVKLASGGYLADTPGIRNLNVWDVEPDELDAYFVDIAQYVHHCRFSNCTHTNEPGCAVRQAVKDGHIAKSRYKSFMKLREELRDTYIVYQR